MGDLSNELAETAYWWEAAPLPDLPEQPIAGQCDVAVVGAGYAGLSAALTLARAGRSVQVFDRDRPGEGASSRNGGIASGNIRTGFGALIKAAGLERAKAIYGEGIEARDDLVAFVKNEAIDCDFQPCGRFTGAYRPANYEAMGREADLLNRHLGLAAHTVPRADQHQEIGSDLYHGGMVRPDIGGLHPGKLHLGILDKTVAAGAVVHGLTRVAGVTRDRGGFTVQTARGTVKARDVVVATNGYTDTVDRWLCRRLVPVPSQIIATEPLDPELMARLMPKQRMLGESRKLYHYFRPSPDGTRVIFGGRAGALASQGAAKAAHLQRDMVEIFPDLADAAISHIWWGNVAFNLTFQPVLMVRDGIHYACGFCGSGVVWARWLGNKAAYKILGDERGRSAFEPERLIGLPFYNGTPYFLPLTMAWFGTRDRLGV